jgi:hypothetical protein
MSDTRIDFESVEWQRMAPGARHKVVERAGKRVRLVEFTSEFVERDWCLKGHAGYVLAGDLAIQLEDRVVRLGPGDGLVLRGGGGEKHKASVIGASATLVLIEDI